jgi:hypothetical protein
MLTMAGLGGTPISAGATTTTSQPIKALRMRATEVGVAESSLG